MLYTKRGPRPRTNKPFTNALAEGLRLAEFRETYNYKHRLPGEMTQSELAAKAGLSRPIVGLYEQGNRPMTPRSIRLLAEALEIDPRQPRMNYQPEFRLAGAAA